MAGLGGPLAPRWEKEAGMTTRRALYEVVESTPEKVVIRDIGHDRGRPSVTNDAEAVVAELGPKLGSRRLFYFDSQGDLDELLHVGGVFAGFAPGPGRAG